VSAYALFFRDTQAAIKGQNPSASFGEVSKIVASMWDTLGEEQKQVGGALAQDGRRIDGVFESRVDFICLEEGNSCVVSVVMLTYFKRFLYEITFYT